MSENTAGYRPICPRCGNCEHGSTICPGYGPEFVRVTNPVEELFPQNTGWQCPVCQKVLGPHVDECIHLNTPYSRLDWRAK